MSDWGECILVSKWGKDHWSTFAYLETLAVDFAKGGLCIPEPSRMRTNRATHAATGGGITPFGTIMDGVEYPTRLSEGEVKAHDDWDCVDDAVSAGFLTDEGSGINRAFKFTKRGLEVAAMLRAHKVNGGSFSNFVLNDSVSVSA